MGAKALDFNNTILPLPFPLSSLFLSLLKLMRREKKKGTGFDTHEQKDSSSFSPTELVAIIQGKLRVGVEVVSFFSTFLLFYHCSMY